MKRTSHVTLHDIAKKLKVSQVTVSKALRGHTDISDETTKRIRKLAKLIIRVFLHFPREVSS